MSTEDTHAEKALPSSHVSHDTFSTPIPHHISDTDVWGPPDRNYYIFVVLTFLLGFFGLDHFYLRSNETAMKKFLMNVCGLGFWYIWDILQVLQEGKRIRKEGLNSPFDWIRGIGRGTFQPLPADLSKEERAKKGGEYAAPKSYVIYTILAVCVGFLGMDKFYLGETWKGFAKLFSTLNIFLFLFGLFWVIWDAFHAIFMTESILKEGITAPMPFNFFFSTPTDASALFKVQPVSEERKDTGFLSSLFGFIPTPASLYKEFAVPLLQPTVGTVIGTASKLAAAGTSAAALAPSLPSIVGQSLVPDTLAQAQQVQQVGGGSEGPGPILAGALTALILAGGLKGISDFLAKRHG